MSEGGSAHFSPDKKYRYALYRRWSLPLLGEGGRVCFFMLNPSTADADTDDPTVRRCIGFAKAWGFDSLVVLNLFAFRSPNPDDLAYEKDPVGPLWAEESRAVLKFRNPGCEDPLVNLVVCAWGNYGVHRSQGTAALELIEECGHIPHALRVTRDFQPTHPLYLPRNLKPRRLDELVDLERAHQDQDSRSRHA